MVRLAKRRKRDVRNKLAINSRGPLPCRIGSRVHYCISGTSLVDKYMFNNGPTGFDYDVSIHE